MSTYHIYCSMLKSIKYIIYVDDMSCAIRFYTTVFKLKEAFSSPHWSELKFEESTVALHGGRENDDPIKSGLSFQVDHLETYLEYIIKQGGRVIENFGKREGEPIKLATAADPDNNIFSITEFVG